MYNFFCLSALLLGAYISMLCWFSSIRISCFLFLRNGIFQLHNSEYHVPRTILPYFYGISIIFNSLQDYIDSSRSVFAMGRLLASLMNLPHLILILFQVIKLLKMRIAVIAGGNECIERMWKRKKKVKRRVIWAFKLEKETNVIV